jgi:hypothetical protein
MKKINGLVLSIVLLLMLLTSCKKDNNPVDYSVIDNEKSEIEKALELTQAFNDTLIMVYDTAIIHRNNVSCNRYDSLYHQSDSMFNIHYTRFCDEMYGYGIMMNNYTPTNGMMQGGMLNRGTMDMDRMMNDTSTVGGYFRNMQQLHIIHQPYHSGIFN